MISRAMRVAPTPIPAYAPAERDDEDLLGSEDGVFAAAEGPEVDNDDDDLVEVLLGDSELLIELELAEVLLEDGELLIDLELAEVLLEDGELLIELELVEELPSQVPTQVAPAMTKPGEKL
jgi:hypothetical protein